MYMAYENALKIIRSLGDAKIALKLTPMCKVHDGFTKGEFDHVYHESLLNVSSNHVFLGIYDLFIMAVYRLS